ncbi:TIR domain-containing protein [Paraclostridium bifermentans]|uniref:TIR domain-containing protein n=1 Tax=Paraclostridium bifermentans TaxID=1490 RepID=UPI001C7ED8FC|nr:nucleotide-binding protein [Paraclostridium bifermentans]GIM32725.1 hypothetical protein PAGU1678_19950 [Paraclostridium bifermentans subsp. muricolitidis]
MSNIELLRSLLEKTKNLKFEDSAELDDLMKKSELYIRKVFGENSKYIKEIHNISFYPMVYPSSDDMKFDCWHGGKIKFTNTINTMIEELVIFGDSSQLQSVSNKISGVIQKNKKVFIVHGHNEAMKESVARCLEKLDLEAIILHEKSDKGRNILQKLEEEGSEASFAIVLLSGDDKCVSNENPEIVKTRARQNVILELGYFIGKLGKQNVLALYNSEENFEMPSDYTGILYTKYDSSGNWKLQLGKELKASGLDIDLNKLI